MPEEDSDDDHVGLSTMLLSATDGNESGGSAEEIEMIPISLHEYEWKKESSKQDTQDGPASSFSSVVNLTNTILGAGMLGMARAIQSSGLILGMAIIAMVSVFSGLSILLLNSSATKLEPSVTPSYYKLAEAAFPIERRGQTAWGPKITAFVMAMTTFSGATSFLIIVADAVCPLVAHFAGMPIEHVPRPAVQIASMVVVLPLSLLENLDSLYTGYSVARGERGYRGCNNQLNTKVAKHATEMVFGDAVAEECVPLPLFKLDLSMIDTISVATLAYTCQMNVFTVRRELRNSTPRRWTAVWASSNFVALLVYLTVGSAGYIAFGEDVAGNVVVNLEQSDKLVIVGRAMLAFSFIVSIPMMVHPCVKNMMLAGVQGSRRTVVLMTLGTALAISTAISDVGLLFRWFGGPNSALMAYILPPLFYYKLAPLHNRKHRASGIAVFTVGVFYLSIKVVIPIVSTVGLLLGGIKADTGEHAPSLSSMNFTKV
eukprot:gene1996-16010_t